MFLSNSSDNEKSFSIKKNFLNWKNKMMFLRRWRGSSISNYRWGSRSTDSHPCTYIIQILISTINIYIYIIFTFILTIYIISIIVFFIISLPYIYINHIFHISSIIIFIFNTSFFITYIITFIFSFFIIFNTNIFNTYNTNTYLYNILYRKLTA